MARTKGPTLRDFQDPLPDRGSLLGSPVSGPLRHRLRLSEVWASGEVQPREVAPLCTSANGAPIRSIRPLERRSIAPARACAIGSTSCSFSPPRGTALPQSVSSARSASPTRPLGACAIKSGRTWPRSTATIPWAASARLSRLTRRWSAAPFSGKGPGYHGQQDCRRRDARARRRIDYPRGSEPARPITLPRLSSNFVLPAPRVNTDESAATRTSGESGYRHDQREPRNAMSMSARPARRVNAIEGFWAMLKRGHQRHAHSRQREASSEVSGRV